MSDPFLGEIRVFGFDFPPKDWALCDGSLLSINQYAALYALLGTKFGGNGTTQFALPNLIGRVPVGAFMGNPSTTYPIGEVGGQANVILDRPGYLPIHNHAFIATTADGSTATPTGNMVSTGHTGSKTSGYSAAFYSPTPSAATAISPSAISLTGNGQPHNNMQPYLVLNFCISLAGVFPPRPPQS